MIIVIVQTEHNKKTGRAEPIVSHGIDPDTGKTIILPQESPEKIGAFFDRDIGGHVIRDKIIRPGMACKARLR